MGDYSEYAELVEKIKNLEDKEHIIELIKQVISKGFYHAPYSKNYIPIWFIDQTINEIFEQFDVAFRQDFELHDYLLDVEEESDVENESCYRITE